MKRKNCYLLLRYPIYEFPLEDIAELHHSAQWISDHMGMQTLTIPREIDWCEMSKEDLIKMRDLLNTILEGKTDDSNDQARTGTETCG